VGVGVTVGVDVGVPPLHVTPLSTKVVGAAFVPLQVPWNPNDVLPPAGISPFHAALEAVTLDPVWTTVAFQPWVTRCPDGKAQVSVQPCAASPGLTRTSAVKPPGQEFAVQLT
jgi:hypothetical protein